MKKNILILVFSFLSLGFVNAQETDAEKEAYALVVKISKPAFDPVVKQFSGLVKADKLTDFLKEIEGTYPELFKSTETVGRGLLIIPESDVYRLIMRSRLPEAERFEEWVVGEVLPSIRKHGGYLTPEKLEETLLNPDTLIKLATNLKDEQEKRFAAEAVAEAANAQIEADRPKVLFAESIETSVDTILVGDLAKLIQQATGYQIGQRRLFAWMREECFLHKAGSNYNLPTQRSMNLKVFVVKETTHTTPNGTRITRTPKVTGKGQTYFINKFAQIQQDRMTQAAMMQFPQGATYAQQ